ncbi:superoxide dismutase [Streptomyces sp. DSM 44917]|uniref:Superoxide dismutase n=1 Tax=Streptomyces boetiae TaxID=3075541 RepID=A0ABU2L7Y1_9ACTN|nr:superoxide dismutase [Streptomyces sp. DSM 44917]MDT0307571.1 superoxide dismutase [Streptomyces sp. DSM 44917]
MPRVLRRRFVTALALATALPLVTAAQLGGASADAPASPASAGAGAPGGILLPGAPEDVRIDVAHELPGERVYPEGVTVDPRTGHLFAGSFEDGTIYRMTPGRRVAETFLPAGTDGRDTANGLTVDAEGRLWVTDSTTGVTVYDADDGRRIASFEVPGDAPRFVNDLTVAPDGTAYLTDTVRAVVYAVTPEQLAAAAGAECAGPLTVRHDLSGVIQPQPEGTYTLNGIVADPVGAYLLVVDMAAGDLYRVDTATQRITRVALSGGDMVQGDGMVLRDGRLWLVQNGLDTLSRWSVSADGTRATLSVSHTDESLQFPTTLTRRDGRLYVVRSQFDRGGPSGPGTPEPPFTIAEVTGL